MLSYNTCTYLSVCKQKVTIGLVGKAFANSPGDQGSLPGRVIPMT